MDKSARVLSARRWQLGGDEMQGLAKTFAVVAICLAVTNGPWARGAVRPGPRPSRPKPIVRMAVPNKPLEFGQATGPGLTQLKAETTVRVAANCPFRLLAFFQGLTTASGHKSPIPAEQVTVTINGKQVPTGTELVEIAKGGPTPMAGVSVPIAIVMEVKGASGCPAGQYGGNLSLKAVVGP